VNAAMLLCQIIIELSAVFWYRLWPCRCQNSWVFNRRISCKRLSAMSTEAVQL